MKHLLLAAMIFASTAAFAIVPDTSKQGIQAVKMNAKSIVIGKPDAKSVGLRVVSDNLSDRAGLYFVFFSSDNDEYTTVYEGNIDIRETDYDDWKASSNSSDFLFSWFADEFGFTLK